MVDVSDKCATVREASASGCVVMKKQTLRLIRMNKIAKGNVLGTARIAGIMAAKRTSEIVPMCHPISISSARIDFSFGPDRDRIHIVSTIRCTGQTGVEMEALTAVSAAALTIYDMCKSADRGIVISDILLVEKRGGKSGTFKRNEIPSGK